jgi:TrmH family RNA methyltransferase
MAIRIIQSKQNARVKELRAALLHPGRGESGLVALEGIHLLAEAIRSGLKPRTVFVTDNYAHLLGEFKLPPSTEVLSLTAEVLASVVTTESPQPVAALLTPRLWDWPDLLTSESLLVVLAGIQDPGNLGAILRSAEAFGATGAICLPGTVSPWNPKAMRASAGSVFRVPLIAASVENCFDRLHKAGVQTLAAMAREAQPLEEANLAGPIALFIGSEGSGLAPELAAACDGRITIPCPGPVESLNAAVAASVLLYEAFRQRSQVQKSQIRKSRARRKS